MKLEFMVPASLKPYQRLVQANRVKLHLYDSGQTANPATYVLLHGLGDEADSWRKVFPLLAGHGRVIAPDLPGFGRSDHPRRAYTLNFYADTVIGLLEPLKIARAVLVGSSMGAAVSLRVATRRPDLLQRLVLLDGPPIRTRINKTQLLFLIPGQGESIYNGLRGSQDAAYVTLQPYYAKLDALPAEDQAFLRERVWARVWSDDQRRAFFSTFRWLALEGLLGNPNPAKLRSLSVPTTVVWGDQDHIVPLESGKTLAEWIPNAQLRVIPNCGHLPQQEQPQALARLVI